MKNIVFVTIMLVFNIIVQSQIITVVDKTNLKPIQDVIVTNQVYSFLTDAKGQLTVDKFANTDTLCFYHVGYQTKRISFTELSNDDFKVNLSEKSYSLDEVVVSARRFNEKRKDVLASVEIIKSKDIEFYNPPSSAEVIQNTGNVSVQKSQLGGGSPVIRGFEANKVLIVVDGVRMNNAIYRGGHLQNVITIDNAILEKAEIVFGPGSVVYGSDALGGVMHFYTKKPLLSTNDKALIKVNALTRYSTANNEKTGHIDLNLGGKKFSSLSSITFSEFGDLMQGKNRNPFYGDWGERTFYVERFGNVDSVINNENSNLQKGSAYSQYDVTQKFLYKQSDKIMHLLNFQYSTSTDIPRYDRLTQMSGSDPKYAEWYYGPQNRLMAAYSLSLKNNKGFYDDAGVILAYQNIEESRHDRKFGKDNRNNRTEKLDVITLNADFNKKIKKNELNYGFEGTYNKVNSTAFKENIVDNTTDALDTRYPDGGSDMQTLALYFTHTIELKDKIVLYDGIRVSNVRLNALFNDTTFFPFPFNEVNQNNTSVNGNFGIAVMPGSGWRFTLLGSSGFRTPNVDDLSKVFESVPGCVIVPNPDLKPEYTYNADLGISKSFTDRISVGISGYYTWYINAITTEAAAFNGEDSIMYNGSLSQVTMNTNAGEAYIYGANANLSADITDNFSIYSTINYTYGRIITDSVPYPLDHIPPVFGKTSFKLNLDKFKNEFYIMYNGWKALYNYNMYGEDNVAYATDYGMPAWYTLNFRTAYQLTQNLQMQFAVENILDVNYRSFGSNISAPGRNFIVSLRANM